MTKFYGFVKNLGIRDVSSIDYYIVNYYGNSTGWKKTENALKSISEIATNNKIICLFVVIPFLTELTDNHPYIPIYNKIEKSALKYNCSFIDLFSAFKGKKAPNLKVSITDGHPNKEAHDLIGLKLYEYLMEGDYFKYT